MKRDEFLGRVATAIDDGGVAEDALDRLASALDAELARIYREDDLKPRRVKHDLTVKTVKVKNADGKTVERTTSTAAKTECPDCGRTLIGRVATDGIAVLACARLEGLAFDVSVTEYDIVACGVKDA